MAQASSLESLSRTAEKLIILLDYSNGLLTRVHGCVHYRRGPVNMELTDKVIEHLSQKKEDPTINIVKAAGSDAIQMKAEALENETRFSYETISDILQFTNEVVPLFETLVTNIMVFDLHKNTDLTARFLGVFFNFVKLYFLAARMSDSRVAAYLYMLAYKAHTQKDPDDAHLVKKFMFENYYPLRQLQTHMQRMPRVSDVVYEAVNGVIESFKTWTNYESLQQGQFFSVSQQNPAMFSHPVSDEQLPLYTDASYLDNVGTWIIYLYLLFPNKLAEKHDPNQPVNAFQPPPPLPSEQLAAALNDRVAVILYRDEIIDAIQEYKNVTNASLNELKVKSKPINNVLKQVNVDQTCGRHRRMRELLRREIRGLLDLTQAMPGVIPVKLPILMACLALARYEIFWVFSHMSLKGSKTKLKESQIAAPFLPDLIHHTLKLLRLILDNSDLIKEYYKEQLKLDLKGLTPYAADMRSRGSIDKSILDNVDFIINQVVELQRGSGKVKSLEGLRLNWYRASADASREPAVLSRPEGIALVQYINPLIEHTRYFDRLEKEVDARGNMHSLWFFRPHLAHIFNNYCLGKVDESLMEEQIKGNNPNAFPFRQGRYWIVFLEIFSQALLNVHRQRPDELDEIGVAVLKKSEQYLNGSTSKIEVSMRAVLGQYSVWNSQTQPQTVAEHLVANRGQKGQWKQLPGYESYWPNRKYLINLKFNLDIIGDMCSSFAEVDSLIIYNQRIYPSAYLYQLMHDFFYQELRLLVQENQHTMVRPSRFISRLERLFRAASCIGQYVNLDLERMTRDLLYKDFYDDSVGLVGESLGMQHRTEGASPIEKVKKPNGLIHDIRDWYVGIVDSRCAKPNSGAIYSPILNGFYDLKQASHHPLQDYCSLAELESLCRVIGPSGVRVIDIEVVKIGHSAMQKISKILKDNRDLIQGVQIDKFYGEDRWKNTTSRFRGLDEISKQGVVVGSVILFRKLLRKALFNVVRSRNGFLADTVKEIHDRLYNQRIYNEAFSHLALDTGLMSTFSDNVMRNVFYQLGAEEQNSKTKLWNYVPLVFGICFADSFWKDCRYNQALGALDNNGFAMAECVHNLISIFCDQASHRKMKLLFLGIAGRTMLYLKKTRNDPSVNHMFLFLEHFVNLSKDVTLHDLQTVSIPYDVIRSQLVKIYGDASGYFTEAKLELTSAADEMKDDEEA